MILPLDWTKAIYLLVMTVFVGICNAGGMGGGGVSVPYIMFLFDCDAKTAINIAYVYNMFGSLGNSIQNSIKKHPVNPTKPLINFDLALISLNGVIYGAMVGFVINRLSYDILIISTLFLVDCYILIKNCLKIRSLQQLQNTNNPTNNNEQMEDEFNEINDQHQFSRFKYFIVIIVSSIILILIKGSPKLKSIVGLPICGYPAIICYILMAIIHFLFYKAVQSKLIVQNNLNDQQVSSMNNNGLNAFIAGSMSGFLGIGGGIILTANWFQMGLHPQESTATSTFVIIFTASISVVQTFFAGQYLISDFLIFSISCIISSYLIANLIYFLAKKLQQPLLTIYLTNTLLTVGISGLIYATYNKIVTNPMSLITVNGYC